MIQNSHGINAILYKFLGLTCITLTYSIVLFPAFCVSSCIISSYYGLCLDNSKVISDDEHIRNVISVIIKKYPHIVNRGKHVGTHEKGMIDPAKLIRYESVDEFLKLNPFCCSFSPYSYKKREANDEFLDKIAGHFAGYVNIKYRVRYFSDNGEIEEVMRHFSSKRDNCGRGVD